MHQQNKDGFEPISEWIRQNPVYPPYNGDNVAAKSFEQFKATYKQETQIM